MKFLSEKKVDEIFWLGKAIFNLWKRTQSFLRLQRNSVLKLTHQKKIKSECPVTNAMFFKNYRNVAGSLSFIPYSKTGASNPSWSLGRRSAFFSYFEPQFIKNLRKIGQNTDFSLNSESSLGRTNIFLGRRLDAPALKNAWVECGLWWKF